MDLRLTFAAVLWCLLLGTALVPLLKRSASEGAVWRWTVLVFAGLLGASLVAWRWRSLMYEGEINVDESQVLSQAMRYLRDPLPWRSVDGGSSGPLNTWVVMWAPLFGLELGYIAARITSILCLWSMFLGLALALAEIAGRRLALLLLLPAATFLLTTTNFDFVFFSSEQLPSALSAWIVYLIAAQVRAPRSRVAYSIGLLTGALPFCKIQVGPVSVLLFAAAAAVVWQHSAPPRQKLRLLLVQAMGGLSVPFLILFPVLVSGVWREFFEFYIRSALLYKNAGTAMQKMDLNALIFAVREFGVLSVSSLVLSVLALSAGWFIPEKLTRDRRYLCALLGSAAYFCLVAASILKTGYPFPHYLMLLIVPTVTLLGVSYHPFKAGTGAVGPTASPLAERGVLFGAFAVGLAVLFQAGATVADLSRNSRLLANWGPGLHPLGEVIKGLVKPGDTIAVWGWAPKFYVMSQTAPAYRFSQSIFLLDTNPSFEEARSFYLDSFLSDLRKEMPKLFVDAPDEFVWPSYPQGVLARHWTLPVLSDFVRRNYTLVGNMESPPGKAAIMIYRLKEASQP
jgi:hypothetical protein